MLKKLDTILLILAGLWVVCVIIPAGLFLVASRHSSEATRPGFSIPKSITPGTDWSGWACDGGFKGACFAAGAKDDLNTIREITYFNKPTVLYVGEPVEIKLVLVDQVWDNDDVQLNFLSLPGSISHNIVKVGSYVSAVLTAPEVNIKANSERIQSVEADTPIIFSWFVEPLKIGKIPIRLDLFSQASPEKDAPGITIQVMQDEWVADARGLHWLEFEIAEFDPLSKTLIGLGGTIGALLAFFGVRNAFPAWFGKRKVVASKEDSGASNKEV
jgi:hypothetical protein